MTALKCYTIYLKDGRTAEALGVRLEPNLERAFQGQTRSFVAVSDGQAETAVFLAGDVLGWTVTAPHDVPTNGATPGQGSAPPEEPQPLRLSTAPVYSAPVLGG